MEEIVKNLNGWQPEMLVSYASMARILADEQIAGRLWIAPHLVFTSSEVLTEETRRRAEAAWDRPVFNQYAATESGGLAAECCEHRGMHLYEDNIIFENVDGKNRPVEPGDYGEKLLITVLFSRTQPLIRYELSDSVRVAAAPCPCGRPFALIEDIQGRMEEVIHLPSIDGRVIAVHPNTFHEVMDGLPVSGWQIVEEADGLNVFLSGSPDAADEKLAERLIQALRVQGVRDPRVKVQLVSSIPRAASGKAPLIKSGRLKKPEKHIEEGQDKG